MDVILHSMKCFFFVFKTILPNQLLCTKYNKWYMTIFITLKIRTNKKERKFCVKSHQSTIHCYRKYVNRQKKSNSKQHPSSTSNRFTLICKEHTFRLRRIEFNSSFFISFTVFTHDVKWKKAQYLQEKLCHATQKEGEQT